MNYAENIAVKRYAGIRSDRKSTKETDIWLETRSNLSTNVSFEINGLYQERVKASLGYIQL